jgi:hypothetical protein
MKDQSFRRLLTLCLAALAVLVLVQPGLAQGSTAAKTAENGAVAAASLGLEASLGAVKASAPASCLSIQCSISCDNGLSYTQSFTNTLSCFSYSDGHGCRSTGLYSCSDKPAVAGC